MPGRGWRGGSLRPAGGVGGCRGEPGAEARGAGGRAATSVSYRTPRGAAGFTLGPGSRRHSNRKRPRVPEVNGDAPARHGPTGPRWASGEGAARPGPPRAPLSPPPAPGAGQAAAAQSRQAARPEPRTAPAAPLPRPVGGKRPQPRGAAGSAGLLGGAAGECGGAGGSWGELASISARPRLEQRLEGPVTDGTWHPG